MEHLAAYLLLSGRALAEAILGGHGFVHSEFQIAVIVITYNAVVTYVMFHVICDH